MSAAEVFLSTVVPISGGLMAIVMYCSPLKAAYTARQQQSLGDLNPVPFSVTFVSTACWNAYGLAAPDYNMFLPNIPGFCAALSTSVTCYALASRKVQDLMMSILCSSSCIVLLLGVITRFVCSPQQGKLLWGILCNIITIAYYGAPLSSAWQVVRSRNSASIYLPTCIANLANATLWVAYGFAVHDFFIWVPNGVGGIFAILLITLCFIYPKKDSKQGSVPASIQDKLSGSKDGLLDEHLRAEEGIQAFSPEPVALATVEVVTSSSAVKATTQSGQQVLKAEDNVFTQRYAAGSAGATASAAATLGVRTRSIGLDR